MEKFLKPLVLALTITAGFLGFKYVDNSKQLKELSSYKFDMDSAITAKRIPTDGTPVSSDSLTTAPGTVSIVVYDISTPTSTVNGATVTISKVNADNTLTRCDQGVSTGGGVYVSANCNQLVGEYVIDARSGRWVGQVRTRSAVPIERIMLGL